MATEILAALIGLFCTIVSSVVTFFLTKKKYNSEVEAQQIQNIKEAFDTYKMTVKDTIDTQNEKINALQLENNNLKQQISLLQTQIVNLVMTKSMGSISSVVQAMNPETPNTEG